MFSVWKCKRGNILDIISVKVLLLGRYNGISGCGPISRIQFILGLVSFFEYAGNDYEFKTKENKI